MNSGSPSGTLSTSVTLLHSGCMCGAPSHAHSPRGGGHTGAHSRGLGPWGPLRIPQTARPGLTGREECTELILRAGWGCGATDRPREHGGGEGGAGGPGRQSWGAGAALQSSRRGALGGECCTGWGGRACCVVTGGGGGQWGRSGVQDTEQQSPALCSSPAPGVPSLSPRQAEAGCWTRGPLHPEPALSPDGPPKPPSPCGGGCAPQDKLLEQAGGTGDRKARSSAVCAAPCAVRMLP